LRWECLPGCHQRGAVSGPLAARRAWPVPQAAAPHCGTRAAPVAAGAGPARASRPGRADLDCVQPGLCATCSRSEGFRVGCGAQVGARPLAPRDQAAPPGERDPQKLQQPAGPSYTELACAAADFQVRRPARVRVQGSGQPQAGRRGC
jgi:hypothetical protein